MQQQLVAVAAVVAVGAAAAVAAAAVAAVAQCQPKVLIEETVEAPFSLQALIS